MRRWHRREWERLITAFARSGLTQGEFAARRKLSVETLRAWIYRLRREKVAGRAATAILPVRVVGAAEARDAADEIIEVVLVSGVRVRARADIAPPTLAALVAALG